MLGVILAVIILFLLLLLIGIPLATIFSYAVLILCILVGLTLLLIFLFFFGTILSMPRFHRKNGKFIRFSHAQHFDRAVYEADGEEYTCLFPAENVARSQIYTDKPRYILVHSGKKHKTAYDRHSLLIITIGTLFSASSIAALGLIVWKLFR